MASQEYIPYGRKRSQLWCVWLALLNGPCLTNGRGMLSLEFAHWRALSRMQVGAVTEDVKPDTRLWPPFHRVALGL